MVDSGVCVCACVHTSSHSLQDNPVLMSSCRNMPSPIEETRAHAKAHVVSDNDRPQPTQQ